jgi:hypothetical protein
LQGKRTIGNVQGTDKNLNKMQLRVADKLREESKALKLANGVKLD